MVLGSKNIRTTQTFSTQADVHKYSKEEYKTKYYE